MAEFSGTSFISECIETIKKVFEKTSKSKWYYWKNCVVLAQNADGPNTFCFEITKSDETYRVEGTIAELSFSSILSIYYCASPRDLELIKRAVHTELPEKWTNEDIPEEDKKELLHALQNLYPDSMTKAARY